MSCACFAARFFAFSHCVLPSSCNGAASGDAPLYRLASAALVVRDDRVAGLLADLEIVAALIAEQSLDPTLRALNVGVFLTITSAQADNICLESRLTHHQLS